MIRIGTIGSGFIVKTILKNVARTEGIECRAVYSRKQETGRALADEFGVEKVYTDLDALCADPELDFIYVASPNSLHYDHVKKALAAGKNVLCEKPFVPTAKEARELIDLAKSKDLYLFEMITTLYHPHAAWIREKLPKLGKLQMISATFCQYSSRYDLLKEGKQTNIFDPAFKTGTLMDINVYNIYFVVSLLGRPEKVEYFAGLHENGIDTHGTVVLQYGDVVCQCTGAKDTLCESGLQILGDKGYLKVGPAANNLRDAVLVLRSEQDNGPTGTNSLTRGQNREEVHLTEEQWFYEIQMLTGHVEAGNRKLCYENLEIAYTVAETLERARKSAGLGF